MADMGTGLPTRQGSDPLGVRRLPVEDRLCCRVELAEVHRDRVVGDRAREHGHDRQRRKHAEEHDRCEVVDSAVSTWRGAPRRV